MAPSKAALAHQERVATAKKSAQVSSKNGGAKQASPAAGPSIESQLKKGSELARREVEKIISKYKIVDPSNLDDVPRFARDELKFGRVLGRGGFGTVNEITGINMFHKSLVAKDGPNPEQEDDFESRAFIAEHCIRADGGGAGGSGGSGKGKGDARYAVKHLSDDIKSDPKMFVQGIMDMNLETHFLAAVEHPNIIKMRAVAHRDPFDKGYFIVMDRLYDTLQSRVQKWAKTQKSLTSVVGKAMDKKGKKKQQLLEDRLVAAFDLSAALSYLHGLNIVYRDLKPENIGFDVRGDVKLFDFGLAREVDPKDKAADGLYKMTGDTGSLRYMAPEVAKKKNYDFSVDTYSFSVLLWQIMALATPFSGYNVNTHWERAVLGGSRPKVDEKWPISLRQLIQRGWSEDIEARPPMSNVTTILKKEVVKVREGDDTGLEHMRRRSTFVLRKK